MLDLGVEKCQSIPVGVDACIYVRDNCQEMAIGTIDYLQAYYCAQSTPSKAGVLGLILFWLALLFLTIGMAAYDYLCPNINTIAVQLGMAESLIGVTFLAFGNGAPDLFSTYAAFNSNSGSLAVGELIGAASFIAAVVVGSMAITRPFQVSKRSFLRDCIFFVVALIFIIIVLIDGKIEPWECLVLMGLYAAYVALAVGMQYYYTRKHRRHVRELAVRNLYAEEGEEQVIPADEEATVDPSTPLLTIPDFSSLEHNGVSSDGYSDSEEEEEAVNQEIYAEVTRNMRMNKRHLRTRGSHSRLQSPAVPFQRSPSPISAVRPSLLSAVEFNDLVHHLNENRAKRPYSLLNTANASRQSLKCPYTPATPSIAANNERYFPRYDNDDASTLKSHVDHSHNRHLSSISGSASDVHEAPSERDIHPPNDDSSSLRPFLSAPLCSGGSHAERMEELSIFSSQRNGSESPLSKRDLPQLQVDIPSSTSFVEREFEEEDSASRQRSKPKEIFETFLPSFTNIKSKTWVSIVTAIICAPSVFLMTLSIPVYESDPIENEAAAESGTAMHSEDRRESESLLDECKSLACRTQGPLWLHAVQAIFAPLIGMLLLQHELALKDLVLCAFLSLGWIGILISYAIPTQNMQLVSFIGFFISVLWVSNIATEVVAVLKAIGFILHINEAVLGLTVFAIGNSLGDLIGNVTIANMGFPTMALSACFGGPLLNTLVGVGFSCFVVLIQQDDSGYHIDISRTLTISGLTLLLTLLFLLIAIPLNHWKMTRTMGILTISFWAASTTLNVITDLWLGAD